MDEQFEQAMNLLDMIYEWTEDDYEREKIIEIQNILDEIRKYAVDSRTIDSD